MDEKYEISYKHSFPLVSCFQFFLYLCFRFIVIKSILNTMACICPSRETPSFVFSRKSWIIVSILFYYLLTIYENFSKKLKPNISNLWLFLHMECSEDSPTKNLKIIGTARPMKIVIIPISVQKIQLFSKMGLLISCLNYWYHSDLIQITFFEKVLRRW